MRSDVVSNALVTKIKFVTALEKLERLRDFSQISIEDLCTEAGLSRTTFYRHFDHKYDIVQWLLDEFFVLGLDEIGRSLTIFEGNYITLSGIQRYADFIANSYSVVIEEHSSPNDMMYLFQNDHQVKALTETLEQYHGLKITPELSLQIEAYIAGKELALDYWIQSRMESISIREASNLIADLTPQALAKVLNNPPARKKENTEYIFRMLIKQTRAS